MKQHTFDTLYQKKPSGKTYIWKILVIEHSSSNVVIKTEYGQLDGKMIVKETKIEAGKAGRSILEQAMSEAQSDWNKKVNKGGYVANLKEANTKVNIKPMLAHTFRFADQKNKKGYAMTLPCIGEGKYDGNRCIAFFDKAANKVILQTRTGKVINNFTDIEEKLAKVYESISKSIYFDGELYTDKISFNILNGLIKKKTIDAENKKNIDLVNYYIYDCFDLEHMDEFKQLDRKKFIEEVIPKKSSKLIVVKYYTLNTEADIRKKHAELVKEGFEGIILRSMNGLYELNKRSRNLLKYKDFMDEEFKVVGYHISNDGIPTVVWECETNEEVNGKRNVFSVKPQGTMEERAYLLEHANEYIGKMLTVKFQDFTDDVNGIPRFPTAVDFRDEDEIEP